MRKAWSEKEISFLRDNYSRGSVSFISGKLKRSFSSIRGKALILGLSEKSLRWTSSDEAYLRKNYGIKSRSILAKKLGCTVNAIQGKAVKLGLKGKKQIEGSFTNHRYFQKIDSYTKAYLLGFLSADGCVLDRGDIVFKIHRKDAAAVILFAYEISPKREVKFYTVNRNNTPTKIASFKVCSKKMASDLAGYGIVPRKTFCLKFPKLPKKFYGAYILGYFDGDGSLSMRDGYPLCSIAGTKQFLTEVKDTIESNTSIKISNPARIKNKRTWELRFSGSKARAVEKWVRSGHKLGLKRKAIKFREAA